MTNKAEAYLGPSQASAMDFFFAKIVNGYEPSTFRKKAPLWVLDNVVNTPL